MPAILATRPSPPFWKNVFVDNTVEFLVNFDRSFFANPSAMAPKKQQKPERKVVELSDSDDDEEKQAGEGDLFEETATKAEVRDFLIQYIPDCHGVFFSNEVKELPPQELRHHYEDPRIFFAADFEDYRKSPDKGLKKHRRKHRRLARH